MEKSYPASSTNTDRGLTAWPFWEVFHGVPGFLQWNNSLLWASAGTMCLMSHMNGYVLSVSILWKLCQGSVTGICSCLQHSLTAGNRRSSQGLVWGGVCQKGAQE